MQLKFCQQIALTFVLANVVTTSLFAADSKFDAALRRLDSQTRLEQVCDMEAMARIKQEGSFLPDRAKSEAVSSAVTLGHTLSATGGAFRSRGRWYELSFTCTAAPDHMKVMSFDYQVGNLIPESKWDDLGLWR